MKSLFALFGILVTSLALAESTNENKDIITVGIAELPAQIKLVNEGLEKTYTPAFKTQKFRMNDDANFSMGATTRCDPFIGKTAEEIKIPIQISERFKSGKFDYKTMTSEKFNVGLVGQAVLTIPQGTNTYGRCQNETLNLEALTFHFTDPASGGNGYDGHFDVQWPALEN